VTVVGIDLATKTGLARLNGGKLVGTGKVTIGKTDPDLDVGTIAAFCAGADLVVIESVFCGVNVKTAIDLAVLRGRLVQELDRARVKWVLCAPSTWRKTSIKPAPKLKRKELKRLATAFVATTFGVDVSEDEADAVCLALWGETQSSLSTCSI